MTLEQCKTGISYTVQSLTGNKETNRFLENLGIYSGESLVLITRLSDNFIISVKGVRLGIDRGIAKLIEVVQ